MATRKIHINVRLDIVSSDKTYITAQEVRNVIEDMDDIFLSNTEGYIIAAQK